jgi:hypothetical protein
MVDDCALVTGHELELEFVEGEGGGDKMYAGER